MKITQTHVIRFAVITGLILTNISVLINAYLNMDSLGVRVRWTFLVFLFCGGYAMLVVGTVAALLKGDPTVRLGIVFSILYGMALLLAMPTT
jgi:hypothetical protein